jgi:hypothetical protein
LQQRVNLLKAEEEMSKRFNRIVCLLPGLLMVATLVHAGGVDPSEMPPQEPVTREKTSATPAQISAAVNKVRQAVSPQVESAPVVKEVPMSSARPKAVASAKNNNWLYSPHKGKCEPLENARRQVKSIGSFKTPQEFARQMQQRGYRAFALDLGDKRDQMIRVKIPDLELDLLFLRSGMCR